MARMSSFVRTTPLPTSPANTAAQNVEVIDDLLEEVAEYVDAQVVGSSSFKAVSTDGTNGYPTPTGVGLEAIIVTVSGTPQLSDMRLNGVSL